MSNTPVMDSPEVLGHALCRHVPDMRKGFTIQTRHGDIYVTADDAAPFAGAMERLLMRKISLIQDEQLGQDSDTARVPLYTPKLAAQLERNLATIEENNQRILALEPFSRNELPERDKQLYQGFQITSSIELAERYNLTEETVESLKGLIELRHRMRATPPLSASKTDQPLSQTAQPVPHRSISPSGQRERSRRRSKGGRK